MKTRKLIFGLAGLVLAGSLMLTGCKKKETEKQEEPDKETGSAYDNSYAEGMAQDIQNIGAQGSENSNLTTFKGGNGYIVGEIMVASCATIIPNSSTKTYTVDFGTTGCLGADGRFRKGMLIFNYSASTNSATAYRHPGFSCSVSANGYYVDGNQIIINNKTITNTTSLGFNPTTTDLTWSISANIQIVKPNNGGTITWTCSRTKTLLNTEDPTVYAVGGATPINWLKAKIQVGGTASGTNAGGETFSATATNLVRDMQCTPNSSTPHRHPFISGTLDYTPGSRPTRHINFGAGTCDFGAVVTINGVDYQVDFQ